MGVPFEALIPYGIMLTDNLLSIADVRYNRSRAFEDQAHAERWETSKTLRGSVGQTKYSSKASVYYAYNADKEVVMDRDRRLTGYLRGQTDNPSAPAGFELNNPWRVEKRFV